MDIVPKNYIKELDLAIVFSYHGRLYGNLITRRPQAKQYYMIHHVDQKVDPKLFMLFDKII